jgi:hypothetical protein
MSGVRLTVSPLCTAATIGLLYQSQMIDDGDCGAVGGVKVGRGNRSTRRKPAPMPLHPRQIPHDPGSKPGLRGGKPETNRLSYGSMLHKWEDMSKNSGSGSDYEEANITPRLMVLTPIFLGCTCVCIYALSSGSQSDRVQCEPKCPFGSSRF